MHFILTHLWHLLGLGPVLLIVVAIFAWPVVGPILVARPWIVAVALACIAAYAQQWRVVRLKAELEASRTQRARAVSDWQACKTAAETQTAAVEALQRKGADLERAVAAAAADGARIRQINTVRIVTKIETVAIPSDCEGAAKATVPIWRDMGKSFEAVP